MGGWKGILGGGGVGGGGWKQGSNIKFIRKCFASHAYWMNGFGVEQNPYLGVEASTLFCRHNAYKIQHYHSSDNEDLICLGCDTIDRQAVSDTSSDCTAFISCYQN